MRYCHFLITLQSNNNTKQKIMILKPSRLDIRNYSSEKFMEIISSYKAKLRMSGISATNEMALIKGLRQGLSLIENNKLEIGIVISKVKDIIDREDSKKKMSCKNLYTRSLQEKVFHVKQLVSNEIKAGQEVVAIAITEIGIENSL